QSLSSLAIKPCCADVVAPGLSEIALCHPGGGIMACRRKLVEHGLGLGESRFRLVEPTLVEQRAPEDELRVSAILEDVLAIGEQGERLQRLLLGERRLAGAQVDLCERDDHATGLDVLAEVE